MNKIEKFSTREQVELLSLIKNVKKEEFWLFVDNNIFSGYDLMDKYKIKEITEYKEMEQYWQLNIFIREECCRLAIQYLETKK